MEILTNYNNDTLQLITSGSYQFSSSDLESGVIKLSVFRSNGSFLRSGDLTRDIGFYISFTGIITFKNSTLSSIIKEIDMDRIMLETDSPYLTPVPNRGKLNEPSNVKIIAQKIAEIKELELEFVISKTTENALKLFDKIK